LLEIDVLVRHVVSLRTLKKIVGLWN
jgi:hypothetical protein